MSIGPGVESVVVELYAPASTVNRWDRAVWDVDHWDAPAWHPVDCQVLEVQARYGASSEAGILSQPVAGACDLKLYDPDRLLDPLSSTTPYAGAIRAGTPVRVTGLAPDPRPAWAGFLDSATHELSDSTGTIRAVSAIAYLAQAELAEGAVLPNTLRARVRSVVSQVGLATLVPVSPEVADIDPDPPVSAHDGKSRGAWAIVQDAALDALTYVWTDPTGTIRFTPWGSLPDSAFNLGCRPEGELSGQWLEGLASLESTSQVEAVRNAVRTYTTGTTYGTAVQDGPSINRYGLRRLDVPRIVPSAALWSQRILDDRADAGLQVRLGEVRPYTELELAALLDGQMTGPAVIRVHDDDHGEPVDVDVAILGGSIGITPLGWRYAFVTMIPRAEWEATEPPAPIPPEPPPQPFHTETRVYIATSDALLALTSGGAKYGAGASSSLPYGAWSGWSYRSLVQFPAIPFTGVRRVVSATLKLRTSTQVRVGFGSSPTVELRRITGSWSAGSSSSPSGSNAVVWPGPAVASTAVRANVTRTEGAAVSIACTALVLPWAPASLGGSSAAQRGLALYAGSGSTADTGEVWPVEQGGTSRPELDVVLEVFD